MVRLGVCPSLPDTADKAYFNSNLVRLNDLKIYRMLTLNMCFNSNMVRLDESSLMFPSGSKSCFNSNMVRLDVERS